MWESSILRRAKLLPAICVALTLALLGTPASLVGQTLLGSVVGVVTDSTGALMPGAKVVLTEITTDVRRTAATNSDGSYTFSDVKPGTYTVPVSAPNFKQVVSSNVTLAPAQAARFDAQLEVGSVTESVQVTAQAPTLNTENAQLGDIRTRDEFVNLPLNNRSAMSFRYITSSNYDGGYIAGQRSYFGYYAVDGVSGMSPAWGAWSGPVMTGMSLESVQDITFVTATPTAEYGDVATISVSTRSGTNELHGSAFWEHSNNAFNSAGYFSHAKGKGPLLHEVGGSIGGPVYIPKVYNGKNRTFFFFTWENRVAPGGEWSVTSVPTERMRGGDYTELTSSGVTIYDPTNGLPFAGNMIPSSRINGIAVGFKTRSTIRSPILAAPGRSPITIGTSTASRRTAIFRLYAGITICATVKTPSRAASTTGTIPRTAI